MSEKYEGLKLAKPVNMRKCVITSRYWSLRRRKWGVAIHRGYDFAPDQGYDNFSLNVSLTKQYCQARIRVYSSTHEKVVKVDYEPGGFGHYVKTLVYGFPLYLYYAHLTEPFVDKGQVLSPSQYIGLMGNSGFVYSNHGGDGCHLHHEGREVQSRDKTRSIDLAYYYKNNDLIEQYPEYEEVR